MLYCIQENVFRERNYDNLTSTLDRLNLQYEVVKFDKTTHELIVPEIDTNNVFVFGSSKLARVATELGWNPGSFFGGNHDYEIYQLRYNKLLLNYDSKVSTIKSRLNWYPGEMKFIRPTKDSKVFNGGIFTQTKWQDLVDRIKDDIRIQVNVVKPIYKEARVWVVNGKVVTSSYYKIGNNVMWLPDVELDGINFVKSALELWNDLAPAFVMDIALTPFGWKIVEINCINCSAFYCCDMQKLIIELENTY